VELVKDVRKLAVLRANAIGDYLVSLPALEALRAAYPQAELVLLGAGWHASFLAGRPAWPGRPLCGRAANRRGTRRPAAGSARHR